MKKNILQRLIIIALVTLASLYVVFWPRHRVTAKDFTYQGINDTLRENIRLGLDLRGGSHLVMRVQTEDYLKTLTENTALGVQGAAKDANQTVKEVRPEVSNGEYRIVLVAGDGVNGTELRDNVQRQVDLSNWINSISSNTITWTLPQAAQRLLSDQAVNQAIRIIDSRIDAVGVAEKTLQTHGPQGSHQILLQMPGVDDPERIKKLIQAESRLQLVHVVSPPSPQPVQTYATEQEAIQSVGGTLPPNRLVLPYAERDELTAVEEDNQPSERPRRYVVVERPAVIEGSELRSAEAVSQTGVGDSYQISFALKPGGAQKFGSWTAANINQYMGVVLNDEVKSVAFIKSQITDQGQIDGRFTKESAEDLALTLRSGALPASLVYLEERTVGPSLGADSIRSGVRASIAGLLFVIVFMVIYYRGSGVNAVIALLLNVMITLAGLVFFNATLTLPGIAGLILGLGMAVDSNVLIFERIREELRTGKTVLSAVDQGFDRAFVTIIDTHVTTIVSSLFLFIFGTGPIRGFAVTLVLGLLANLFSAVYVSRTIFIWLLNRKGRRVESLSI
ncbi:MAG: protein translocase subunit SecD [Pyrinomonadaceae bacterium]|nr:protein translocase subunit SecD [Pyrinomonadaceae bacterium]